MNNTISFVGRSNRYFVISKKGWCRDIREGAYKQIFENRDKLELFAKNNNLKLTFTDGGNMIPELNTASVKL